VGRADSRFLAVLHMLLVNLSNDSNRALPAPHTFTMVAPRTSPMRSASADFFSTGLDAQG
jgi:hypothetical protein